MHDLFSLRLACWAGSRLHSLSGAQITMLLLDTSKQLVVTCASALVLTLLLAASRYSMANMLQDAKSAFLQSAESKLKSEHARFAPRRLK